METHANHSEIEKLKERIACLEQDIQSERSKSSDLNRQLAIANHLLLDYEAKAGPAIEEEYRALLQDYEEGRLVDFKVALKEITETLGNR
jgi:hypothetical protein